jgi:RNA polymerase sigma-70 factor, ECF subfamily
VEPESHTVTLLLQSWSQGDESAIERLMPIVYDELRRLARRYMAGEQRGHTLQPTELVNEAYLRLVPSAQVKWECRTQFFGICARAMRRVLVDRARSRKALKRNRGVVALELRETLDVSRPHTDLVALDDALNALAAIDSRKSQVVELRYFGGLDVQETADFLKISAETVQRDWKMAKIWLRRELSGGHPDET